MISCPNKESQSWKNLVDVVGENKAYVLWAEYEGNVPEEYYIKQSKVTRIIDLLDENAEDFLDINEQKEITTETEQENFSNNILFNNEDRNFTAQEVLNNIKINYKEFSKFTKFLIDKLLSLLYTTHAKIRFVDASQLTSFDTVMEYKPSTNEILISKERLAEFDIQTVVSSFLHEVIHSVTVKAFSRPEGMNELMFQTFIKDMFNKYRELSSNPELYGFKDELEFISELMTNKEFQDEIINLDKENNKKSLWNQFIDYLRTLLGLPKNTEYNKLVDEITKVIKSSDYEGGIMNISTLEARAERNYYDLSSIEAKQTHILNGIKDNLEESIKRYDALVKKLKDPTKLKKYSDNLKKVFTNIEAFTKADEIKAISTFAKELVRNIHSLKESYNKEDFTARDIKTTVALYDKYLTAHSLIDEIQDFISELKAEKDPIISREDIIKLQDELSMAKGEYNSLTKDLKIMSKKVMIETLNDRKYAQEVLYKWKLKLENIHKDLKILENKDSWVSKQMNGLYKNEIDKEVEQNAKKLVDNVHFDITTVTKWLVSGISTNSKLIQILQNKLNTIRENIIKRTREVDFELKEIFDEFIKEKGNLSPSEMYKNLLEYDEHGNVYLKGEYKLEFKKIYEQKLSAYKAERGTIESKYGVNSPEFKNFFKNSEFKKWVDQNTSNVVDNKGNSSKQPIDKWKNLLSDLTPIEQKVLLKFREISQNTRKQTFAMQSIISPSLFGGQYYNLPSVTKSNLERVLEGQVTGSIKDAWKDLTEVRPDDLGYETIKTDLAGRPIYDIKINFRGKLEPSQQSLDLFTIYRLEAKNGINFDEKHKAENDITTLVDIAKNKKYYKNTTTKIPIINKFVNRNQILLIKGEESVTYQRMVSLMESNLYDILHKDAGKVGKMDTNKLVGVLNGWTAKLGMWINEIAATVNVLNGKAQLFLETIAGNNISGTSLASAEVDYFKYLPETIQDINSPIKTSFVNQINEMFDTFGLISTSVSQAFIKNTILKANLNAESLQFLQASGEHWLQSVLTMGILKSIKTLDGDSNFIDKQGNITTEENAASLFDMLEKVDDRLQLNPKVIYTTKSLGVKYNEGGKEMVNALIKSTIFRTMGNYDSNMQPEAMRHAEGKLVMMFRRFFVEMGINRFRGFAHLDKKQSELFEEERFYSPAEQEYIEGMYTTTARLIYQSIIPIFKELNFKILSSNWAELTDYEKKNIHKTITELTISFVLLPLLTNILIGLKGDDDDDKQYMWYLLLVTTRLESELQSYIDPNQQYKILNSPIPSLRMIQNGINLTGDLITPWNWDEMYKDTYGVERSKLGRSAKRMIPILNSTTSTYNQKYQYMMYMTN